MKVQKSTSAIFLKTVFPVSAPGPAFLFLWLALLIPESVGQIQIQIQRDLGTPAQHGIQKLIEVLEHRGLEVIRSSPGAVTNASHVIIAGLTGNARISAAIGEAGLKIPRTAEALAVRVIRGAYQTRVVLAGADATGLMYAALDTAQRIRRTPADEDIFTELENAAESPFLTDRSVSTYTMHRRWFEQRLFDQDYWATYFDMLAANRINSYVIIFGYECAGFMAPMYPYFFDVEEFPQVRFNGLSSEQQARNRTALQRVIGQAHERGIKVTFGIWDHIYRAGVQAGRVDWAPETITADTPNVAFGITAENLAPYTRAALRRMLEVFPGVDAIQFRMHDESGLTHEEIPVFWREIFSMLRELKPTLRFDLRAKGLPDVVIENAIEENLPFRIGTKFWMEQIGMPFHPSHVNPQNQYDRRHGYADLLRFPKQYDIHWRVWSGGTLRLLLWGNPDHVRRFVTECVPVYGGKSFEINEMLATKMLSVHHDTEPWLIHEPEYKHYDYEIERYWHYFQLWGRLAYNPNCDPEIWESEFARRFGDKAGPRVMRALHRASEVLPRIVAASSGYQFFPTTRGWSAMMRYGDLPVYASGTGTDIEQFQGYEEAAEQALNDVVTALITPQQSAAWFRESATFIHDEVQRAISLARPPEHNGQVELDATVADLRILAALAEYHAERMPAAIWYNVYLKTNDQFSLDQAVAGEAAAIDAWRKIVEIADGVYGEHLRFGPPELRREAAERETSTNRTGSREPPGRAFPENWKEELGKLEAAFSGLQSLTGEDTLDNATRAALQERMKARPRSPVSATLVDSGLATPGEDLQIEVASDDPMGVESIHLRFRRLTQFEDYESKRMIWNSTRRTFAATIPGEFVDTRWDLMYFVELIDLEGRGAKFPDMAKQLPYVIVPVERD